jgi:hypothetical protein
VHLSFIILASNLLLHLRPFSYVFLPTPPLSPLPRKIAGLSVVFGAASDELWTRALKMLLTDVKFIVAWAAKHSASTSS